MVEAGLPNNSKKKQSPTYKKKREGGGRKQSVIYIAPNFVRKAVTVLLAFTLS